MAYELIQTTPDGSVKLLTDDLQTTARHLGIEIVGIEERANLRPCLQGQPKLAGYIGPCYGGEVEGIALVRYEDYASYASLGQ